MPPKALSFAMSRPRALLSDCATCLVNNLNVPLE